MSRLIPYQPMGRTVCTTTPAEMQAKLAQRCAEAAQKVKVDVQKPQRNPARLVWKKVSDWCIESACGIYRIEKFAPGDVLADSIVHHKYRCLRLVPGHWFWQFDITEDPQAARTVCEVDLNERASLRAAP